jgi:HlyD family secretion protein
MKRKLLIAGAVVVLAALVIVSVRGGGGGKGVKVFAEEAERRDIVQVVAASGQIQPRVKVNISAHVVGKIEKLYVEEGQAIAAGDPFLELERPFFLAERDNARAQLAKSKAEARRAAIALTDQEVRLARAKRLEADGIASPETLEAAALAHDSARLAVEQAREGEKQAQAILVRAEDDLRKTVLYAPIAGRVIALNAEQGEVVVSGTMNNPASVIGTIADLSEILAEIDVDETEVVHLKLEQTATVRVDALPDRSYAGRVVEIGSSGYSKPNQPDVTFFRVRLLLAAPDAALRPGMSSRAEIEVAKHAGVVVVPIQSVVERSEEHAASEAETGARRRAAEPKQVVYVVDGDRAGERPVRTGISDATHVEVLEGVEPGDPVVSGPYRILRRLKRGDRVQVSSPERNRPDEEDDEDDETEKENR